MKDESLRQGFAAVLQVRAHCFGAPERKTVGSGFWSGRSACSGGCIGVPGSTGSRPETAAKSPALKVRFWVAPKRRSIGAADAHLHPPGLVRKSSGGLRRVFSFGDTSKKPMRAEKPRRTGKRFGCGKASQTEKRFGCGKASADREALRVRKGFGGQRSASGAERLRRTGKRFGVRKRPADRDTIPVSVPFLSRLFHDSGRQKKPSDGCDQLFSIAEALTARLKAVFSFLRFFTGGSCAWHYAA